MNHWTRAGVQAYRAGNRQQARRFFRLAEMENPDELQAWLWSVELAETEDEKRRCLEQIILLDPGQVAAWSALAELKARASQKNELPHVSPFVTGDLEPHLPAAAAQEVSSKPFTAGAASSEAPTIPITGKKPRKIWKRLLALFRPGPRR